MLRPIRPDDKARLAACHARLSPESVRRRFLSPKPRLSTTDLRYLTEVDRVDHVALVALPVGAPDQIVAVGRFVRTMHAPDVAEFAIVVADEHQGRGLGGLLAAALADAARERGIRRFSATVLADNGAVRGVLRRISTGLAHARGSGGVDEVLVELAA